VRLHSYSCWRPARTTALRAARRWSTDAAAGKGKAFSTSFVDLAQHGYREKEYFFDGEVVAYEPVGELTEDGKWELTETAPVQFTSSRSSIPRTRTT
jgi:hypothetical protein